MSQLRNIVFNDKHQFNLKLKSSFFQKLRGLIGVKYLAKEEGIILEKCKQVHTFGMKFSIDIIVLNKENIVIGFISNLQPNRVSRYYKEAYYIIELATNNLNKQLFKKGKEIEFV